MKAAVKILLSLILFLSPFRMVVGQDTLATKYLNTATALDRQGNWDEALRNYLKALAIFTKMGDSLNEASITNTIAERYYDFGVYKKSAQYFEKEFLLHKLANFSRKAESAEMAGMSYYYLPSDSLSAIWFLRAAQLYEKAADTSGYLRCTERLAKVNTQMGNFADASDNYKKLLSYYTQKNDLKNIALIMNQSGYLLFKKFDFNSALTDFLSAIEYSKKAGNDDFFLTDVYTNTAICYQNLGMEKEMLDCFITALQHAKTSGRTGEAARIERILAIIYFNKGDNYHAELYFLDCIESGSKSGNYEILQLCYKDYSTVLEKGNDFIKALEYYEKHLSLRDSINFLNKIKEKEISDLVTFYEATEQRIKTDLTDEEIRELELKTLKAESDRRENELKLLLKERELDRSEKDRLEQSLALEQEKMQVIQNEQKVRSLEQQQQIQQLQLKRKDDEATVLQKTNESLEKDKLLKDNELKNEKFARKMAVWLGVLMILVAVIILLSLISSRKKNEKLAESKKQIEKINKDLEIKNTEVLKQNEKIIQQKDIIEQKNQSITDSIQYASRIQTAVLPPIDFLGEWGMENFILYKPKDIVSGDFYWGVKSDKKIILAAGDCTGHGVPGAFMSMLGHAFLDEIVTKTKIENAAMILNSLRDEIINTLKQKGLIGETRDGMDLSLLILDPETGLLDFAGANNPLYIIRDGVIKKIQGDHMPIGIHFTTLTPFTNHIIETKKDDLLYIFSDGYADQFGGPKGKKFMYKPFQNLLLSNSDKPMEIQKAMLNDTFETWKADREQVDDVLVIGIKI